MPNRAVIFARVSSVGERQSTERQVADLTLIEDVTRERIVMDNVIKALKDNKHPIERWYYGHFHQSWTGRREGVLFSMLDIEEFKEIPTSA